MNIRLIELSVRTRQSTETLPLSAGVTFIHGPVSTGKSTVGRLIDYCLGGDLERTPALRSEFVSAQLMATLGAFQVQFERGAEDRSGVRVTWSDEQGRSESVNAPLAAEATPILGEDVFNLSDLIFKLCGTEPIRVRKSKMDPDSPLVRLGFRDVMWYCYLQQDLLDSSFFRMEDPFKRLKSRDVMRFVTGLHSDRMNDLDGRLAKAVNTQRSKRETVTQLRQFMDRFRMGSELDVAEQTQQVRNELNDATRERNQIDEAQAAETHAVDPLREQLRLLSGEINRIRSAVEDLGQRIQQQESLRAELITTKIKAERAGEASRVLGDVDFACCPRCGSRIDRNRYALENLCCLCGNTPETRNAQTASELEALRRDVNDRIDDLADSIQRHTLERERQQRALKRVISDKSRLDRVLAEELARYDSAFVARIRVAESRVAALTERLAALDRLAELPAAVTALEQEAGQLQGEIDVLRSALADEKRRLVDADVNIRRTADAFLAIMREVGFPGVYDGDRVQLDPRNWMPYIIHGDQDWTFFDAGSGGKKTLFNVCYALAVHRVAAENDLPLPTFLIVDSPTKNISQDENPELVTALYRAIYALASREGRRVQFLLIDSDLVEPDVAVLPAIGFQHRRMASGDDSPLISYYVGP